MEQPRSNDIQVAEGYHKGNDNGMFVIKLRNATDKAIEVDKNSVVCHISYSTISGFFADIKPEVNHQINTVVLNNAND